MDYLTDSSELICLCLPMYTSVHQFFQTNSLYSHVSLLWISLILAPRYTDKMFGQNSGPLIQKPAFRAMDTLFRNEMGKYVHLCLVITDTGLVKKIYKGKIRKTVVRVCKQGLIITIVKQTKGVQCPHGDTNLVILLLNNAHLLLLPLSLATVLDFDLDPLLWTTRIMNNFSGEGGCSC